MRGVIHGDASIGNVLHDRHGNPVLIDLDGFAVGPREWDLVLTAIYSAARSSSWSTASPSTWPRGEGPLAHGLV